MFGGGGIIPGLIIIGIGCLGGIGSEVEASISCKKTEHCAAARVV